MLAGEVVATPEGGASVTVVAGDLAAYPADMSCAWDARAPIRKHYRFG